MSHRGWFVTLLLLLGVNLGCANQPATDRTDDRKPVVYAVNYPLAYFARRIGGGLLDVRLPITEDQDPEFWKPGAEVIEAFQQADLILLNGAGYAKWTANASLPLGSCVDTSAGFKDRFITIENAVTHSHGPAGEHTHSGTATITWIDFKQALEQAAATRAALVRLRPAHRPVFEEGFDALQHDLLDLDRELETLTARARSKPLVASHPVFQYWARRYGLKLKSVHWEASATPDAAALAELKKLLAEHPATWMIWEDEPAAAAVAALQTLGVRSAVFTPCGNKPATGDFLTRMRLNLENVRPVFAE